MSPQDRTLDDTRGGAPPSAAELANRALSEMRELIHAEVALARVELGRDVKGLAGAAIALVAGALFLLASIATLAVALALAVGGSGLAVMGIGLGMLFVGCCAGAIAYSLVPKKPLKRTRSHLTDDYRQLKERTI
jgi:uncharacterized membrane protein YqjE